MTAEQMNAVHQILAFGVMLGADLFWIGLLSILLFRENSYNGGDNTLGFVAYMLGAIGGLIALLFAIITLLNNLPSIPPHVTT